jgi:FkbM family methyltransferase
MKRKIFIDAGAYDGDTIKQFYNWGFIIDKPNEFKVYAFEPNPNMKKALLDIESQHKNLTYIPKAVWVKDEILQFAVDTTPTPLGSTVMPGKVNIWNNFDKVDVEAIDFSEWLKQFKNDEVIIKMDIEGAEFPVLKKMIKDKTIFIPSKIMVEFHANKVTEYTTTYKNNFVKRIKKMGVPLEEWH